MIGLNKINGVAISCIEVGDGRDEEIIVSYGCFPIPEHAKMYNKLEDRDNKIDSHNS